MSRTNKEKKVSHCNETGCSICEAKIRDDKRAREYKLKKKILKGNEE